MPLDQIRREGMDGVRQQAKTFFVEGLFHSAAVVSRPAALMRRLVTSIGKQIWWLSN